MEKLAELMKTRVAKIGGGIVAGGSSLMIIISLLSSQIQALDKKIDFTVNSTHEYVDLKHDLVMAELKHVQESQREIKGILKSIQKKTYEGED